MVQTLRDRAILKKILLDGHEVSAFNRHKSKYPIEEDERDVIHDSIKNFEKYLNDLDVEFVELKLDRAKVQEYCLKYALETPDSIHLLAATQNSLSSHY